MSGALLAGALAAGTAAAATYLSYFTGGWAAVKFGSRRSRRLQPGELKGKIVLVTGANAGIGLRTTQALGLAGAVVVMACRRPSEGERARASLQLPPELQGNVVVRHLDLGSIKSIIAFAKEFREEFDHLDILICNAGVAMSMLGSGGFKRTEDGLESMMGVNFLGHYLLTRLLLPALKARPGGRVVALTSVAMSNCYPRGIDVRTWKERPPDFTDWAQYGQSKLAVDLFIEELQRREPTLLCVSCHPGVVASTGLMHPGGSSLAEALYSVFVFKVLAMRAEHGHLTTVHLATAPAAELSPGRCYLPVGRRAEWRWHPLQQLGVLQLPARIRTDYPRLWEESEELLAELGAPLSKL